MSSVSNFLMKSELTTCKISLRAKEGRHEVDSKISTEISKMSVSDVSGLVKETQTMIKIQQTLKKV